METGEKPKLNYEKYDEIYQEATAVNVRLGGRFLYEVEVDGEKLSIISLTNQPAEYAAIHPTLGPVLVRWNFVRALREYNTVEEARESFKRNPSNTWEFKTLNKDDDMYKWKIIVEYAHNKIEREIKFGNQSLDILKSLNNPQSSEQATTDPPAVEPATPGNSIHV